jgi:DNA-binding NarL/FixJ family response regulator
VGSRGMAQAVQGFHDDDTFLYGRNDWREMAQTLHMRLYREHRDHHLPRRGHDVDVAHRVAGTAAAPQTEHAREHSLEAVDSVPSNVIPLYGPGQGPGVVTVANAARPIRVVVAESQTLIRAGYRVLLEADELIEVVAEAATEEEAIAQAAETSPDVMLLDLGLPGLENAEAAAGLVSHPAFTGVAVLLMTPGRCDERVLGALQSGAVGVLAKDVDPGELIRAVQVVARDQAVLPVGVMRELLGELQASRGGRAVPPGDLDELTAREREVVALVAGGLSNHQIAARLVISPATAKTHVSRAMLKLGASHRAQLAVLAYETGLVAPRPQASGRP